MRWQDPCWCCASGLGLTVFAHMIPANSPDASVREIVEFYTTNATGVRTGMVLAMFGAGLFIPWGVSLATQTRRAAPNHPVLFHIQVACSVGACMLAVLVCLAGGLAAFRAGQIPGETTQLLNDVVHSPFPRWFGYFTAWTALMIEAGAIAYLTRSGPFAWNGLLAFWSPLTVFGLWIAIVVILLLKAINRQAAELAATPIPAET